MQSQLEKERKQIPMFDLSGREYNVNYVDETQPLFVADNPAHWKAHKLQILIARMDKQHVNNPAQFNQTIYYQAVTELEKLMHEINKGLKDENLDKAALGEIGDEKPTPAMGERTAISLDIGVSADNPVAG